jgi:quinol monooxygenase YgiN
MTRIALLVDITLVPGREAEFDRLIRAHAAASLAEEPGCERFDVLIPKDAAGQPIQGRVILYELYRDEAALAAHRATERQARNRLALKDLIATRTLTECAL